MTSSKHVPTEKGAEIVTPLIPNAEKIRALVVALLAYFQRISHIKYPNCYWRHEEHVYPWFVGFADAIFAMRSTVGSTRGWPPEASRAIPYVIKAFDETAEEWGWGPLAQPEPARAAYRNEREAWFREMIERPRFEAAISIQNNWPKLNCPYDEIAREGRILGFKASMSLEEGEATFSEADMAYWITCRLGYTFPVISPE